MKVPLYLLGATSAFVGVALWAGFAGDAVTAAAQNTTNTATAQPLILSGHQAADDPSAVAAAPAKKLPYGVDEVLKLCKAQVSENIIINYIQNSDISYNLSSNDILYLKDEGVADHVITAMLDERQRVVANAEASARFAAQAAAQAGAQNAAQQAANAQAAYNYAPSYAPGYDQAAAPSAEPAPSTVYDIPADSSAYPPSYAYDYPGPYYYPSYGYAYGYAPGVVIGFGGGYRGGFHGGGGFHGAGFHGGGFHGSGVHSGGSHAGGGGHR